MKTINKTQLTFPIFLLLAFILFSFITKSNTEKISVPDNEDTIKSNQPKIDVKVNKKYDENGNLIQYDSSYSVIYGSPNADIHFFNFDNDSILAQFKNRFRENSMFNDDFFNHFPEMDNQMDFFNFDPNVNFKQMQEMMKKMFPQTNDSLMFQPQPQNAPVKQDKPENMITL